MSEHFCVCFDHRYAAKGLAMWRSLKKRCSSATLHVLCLNEACHAILAGLQLPDVHLHSLPALEAADPDLLSARANRTLVEYYFTLTPCLLLHVFKTRPEVSRITYVDADLFFFADPQPLLDEVGDGAVGLIEHRFPDELADLERYGRFNVGWLTFRRSPVALACLERWREQCLEWCYERAEPGRFADQKYLDEWPDRFHEVTVIQHKGANVAPWNLNRFEVSLQGREIRVDGQPLLFFHAHGFEPASPGHLRDLNLKKYGVEETPLLLDSIFDPYEKALSDATTEIAIPLAQAALRSDQTNARSNWTMQRQLEVSEAQLVASEADRAARLDVIHALQRKLEASEADRAAGLDAAQALRHQLEVSEADRAARLDAIHALQHQLAASEADRAARLDAIHALQHAVHALQLQLEASEADRAARLDVIHALRQQMDVTEADLVAARTHLGQARSRADAIERSWSWRWTRPLRWVWGLLS